MATLAPLAPRCTAQGERDHPADAIYIRAVQDAEVRPKARKAA